MVAEAESSRKLKPGRPGRLVVCKTRMQVRRGEALQMRGIHRIRENAKRRGTEEKPLDLKLGGFLGSSRESILSDFWKAKLHRDKGKYTERLQRTLIHTIHCRSEE